MNGNGPAFIIVAGASAGGLDALTHLVSGLPDNLPAAIFIVMHLSRHSSPEVIRQHLEKAGSYPCSVPTDGDTFKAGHIYIAPADQHLLLQKGTVKLTKGPHENRYRPSIDANFRSAAANYGSSVIGIILSGMLDDGTSGMSAIKRSGGVCIVQEPAEAAFPGMPESVLNHVDVDHRVPVADMAYILDDLCSRTDLPQISVPADVRLEAEITERMNSNISDLAKIGSHSNFTCPDCGGGLWLIPDDPTPRYRCHTGHAYSQHALAEKQNDALEESLWVSIRMMEERRNLLENLAGQRNAQHEMAEQQRSRAAELSAHIDRLKELLMSISLEKTPPDEGYL